MSAAPSPAISETEGLGKRLGHLVAGAFFALVLLIPKILRVRRNPRSWMLFRIFLAVAGAAMVIVPLGSNDSFVPAIVGLVMFLAAILLPPAKPVTKTEEKARELGALIIVNGGRFKREEAASFAAQLFVSPEQIIVRDAQFHACLAIPVNEITAALAEEQYGRWFLRINWAGKSAVFAYRGVFAEHLARVAESTVASVMQPTLPVLPRSRAASA
jgi:hypothetical protein